MLLAKNYVPGSHGLLKEGLERELKSLDSKNSALSASPHCLAAMALLGVKMDFLQPLKEHLDRNTHTHTCLCTRMHVHVPVHTQALTRIHARMHTHTQIPSRYQACHRAVSLPPLRARAGLEGGWGCLLHVTWMELCETSLEELGSGEESTPLPPPLTFFLLQTPTRTPSLFLLLQWPMPD